MFSWGVQSIPGDFRHYSPWTFAWYRCNHLQLPQLKTSRPVTHLSQFTHHNTLGTLAIIKDYTHTPPLKITHTINTVHTLEETNAAVEDITHNTHQWGHILERTCNGWSGQDLSLHQLEGTYTCTDWRARMLSGWRRPIYLHQLERTHAFNGWRGEGSNLNDQGRPTLATVVEERTDTGTGWRIHVCYGWIWEDPQFQLLERRGPTCHTCTDWIGPTIKWLERTHSPTLETRWLERRTHTCTD